MKKQISLLLCLVCLTFGVQGQTWKQYIKTAKKTFKNQEYGETLFWLDSIQKIDSARFNLHFLQAEAARHYNAFELAEKSYKKVLKKENSTYLDAATLGLAEVLKMQGKYTDAIAGFKEYMVINPDSTTIGHQEAKAQIQACHWAMELIKFNDKDLNINHLGESVNTDFSDFAPIPYKDKLIFSSLRFTATSKKQQSKKYSKILQYEEKDGLISPFDLGTTNEELHTAHLTFSKEGNRMYFNICQYGEGNKIQCKIYTRERVNDTLWSAPKMLPESINPPNTSNSQPNIGYDKSLGKEMLFFVSDRANGLGGMDVWYSYLGQDNVPNTPINLREVNSTKDEFSPFFHNYTQTLYFSSNGRKSLGGHDIYKSPLQESKWEAIDHTGFPLNSSYNDVYFTLNHLGSEGYFSSNREGTKFLEEQISACCYDIFKAEFNSYLLDLKVLTFQNNYKGKIEELEDVKVTVYEIFEDAEKEIAIKVKPEGNSHFYQIKSNKKYRIVAEKDDFFPSELSFDTETPITGDEIVKELYLAPYRLNILTLTDEPPKAALTGVKVRLVEIDKNGKEIAISPLKDPVKQVHYYPLLSNKNYKIYASKDGYDPQIKVFNTITWESETPILTEEIILPNAAKKIKLKDLKPISLYFDNDSPNPGSNDTVSDLTYPMTVADYTARMDEYIEGYTHGKSEAEKVIAKAEMEAFFEKEIIKNSKELDKFTDAIFRRVKLGRSIKITVHAYASPLASEKYNERLTKRRISTMLNFYSSYKDNAMKKYVDEGKITIAVEAHGESNAPEGISDRADRRQESVFGLAASKERRVVIIGAESQKAKPNKTSTQSLE